MRPCYLPSAGFNRFRFNGSARLASQLPMKPPEVGVYLEQRPQMGKFTVEFCTHFCYAVTISKIVKKGGALGGTRVIFVCLELGLVWLIYFGFGLATSHDMPVWLTAFMVVMVDRTVTFITTLSKDQRDRLRE